MGCSHCAGLLDRGRQEVASGGAPAAWGCLMERRRLLLWGAPAARGCSIEGDKRLLLGDLPLRGAASLREGGGCFRGELPLCGAD